MLLALVFLAGLALTACSTSSACFFSGPLDNAGQTAAVEVGSGLIAGSLIGMALFAAEGASAVLSEQREARRYLEQLRLTRKFAEAQLGASMVLGLSSREVEPAVALSLIVERMQRSVDEFLVDESLAPHPSAYDHNRFNALHKLNDDLASALIMIKWIPAIGHDLQELDRLHTVQDLAGRRLSVDTGAIAADTSWQQLVELIKESKAGLTKTRESIG